MNYATKEDLAMWLGYETETGDPDISLLPGDADRLIRNASRLIDYATLNQIDQTNERHLDVAMNATTAQCEYWIDGVGESADINPSVAGYSAGKFSIQFGGSGGSGTMPKLSPRARRELFMGGLLNRKVINI
jgi:hypothetical protein